MAQFASTFWLQDRLRGLSSIAKPMDHFTALNFTAVKLAAAVSAATSGSDSVHITAVTQCHVSTTFPQHSTLHYFTVHGNHDGDSGNLNVFLAVTLTSLTSISAGQGWRGVGRLKAPNKPRFDAADYILSV